MRKKKEKLRKRPKMFIIIPCTHDKSVNKKDNYLSIPALHTTNLDHCRDLCNFLSFDRPVGHVVKASARKAEGPEFESRLRRDFSGSSHTSDLKIGTPVATLPGAWLYSVSTGTGRSGVSILSLGEVESLICSFCLSVPACTIV